MSDIKTTAREQIDKYWSEHDGTNFYKDELLEVVNYLIDLAIADYQTNFEQKHIASAVEVDRKRIVEMIEKDFWADISLRITTRYGFGKWKRLEWTRIFCRRI